MKVSINWLDEWIEVADLDPEELAHRLTMAGLEVDGIDYLGRGHDDIVIGEITAIDEHPDADRLVVCEVDVGDADGRRTIVCGATNMEVGDRVPVALPGSEPPGIDFGIAAREVMGVQSQGMLCSAEELELAGDSDGLMIVGDKVPIGEPAFDALDLKDAILEIDLTPNRSDCLSHLGVAREVAALYDRSLRPMRLEIERKEGEGSPVEEIAGLKVIDEEGCPQYRMAVLEDIEVGPSPNWLQRRLASVGVRSVNSVVDVTNFVLMDVGQPLHAFDLDRLAGPEIVVRRAEEGETLLGIDHNEYELDPDDLVIADAEKPVALAGVMGGADSEVSEDSSRILLECAYFDPTTVRRSAKRHGLHTESSHRFERGIDPGSVGDTAHRAVELLVSVQRETVGDEPTVCQGISVEMSGDPAPQIIDLKPERVAAVLGVDISKGDSRAHLESIGVEVDEENGLFKCRVPTFRGDLTRSVDLVEEVARLHGYDEIPTTLPPVVAGLGHRRRDDQDTETIVSRSERGSLDWLRGLLLDHGLLEAINYSFMGDADLDRLRLGDDDCRRKAPKVANPLVKGQARMRTTLVASLLDNVKSNFAQSQYDLGLFEIGRRYFSTGEKRTLGIVVTGSRRRDWSGERTWDFFELKGLVELLSTPWDIDGTRWARPEAAESYLHPGVQAVWAWGDKALGFVGQLHPAIAQDEQLEQPIYFAEIDIEALVAAGLKQPIAEPAAKYPAVVRDFALLYDDDRPYGELHDAVGQLAAEDASFGAIFESLELFDVYEGEQVPVGRRSLAIKVTYRSSEKTLQEKEIDGADRQLLSHLEESVDAQLR